MPNMLNGPDGSEAPNEDAREARCTCDRTETLLLVGGEPMCPWCAVVPQVAEAVGLWALEILNLEPQTRRARAA